MWSYHYTDQSNDYLQHHGIKGQQWGVRRFQNYDGTLTEEGKWRYNGGLHRAEDVKQDFNNYMARNSESVAKINKLSGKVSKYQQDLNKAYKDYTDSIQIDNKEKKELEKVIDSWYGSPITKDQKEAYDYDIRTLAEKKVIEERPSSLRKIEDKYDEARREYEKSINELSGKIIKEYARTTVYTTKKGFLGIQVFDEKTDGSEFIKRLVSEKKNANYFGKIGKDESNEFMEKAINKITSELSAEWYNKQKWSLRRFQNSDGVLTEEGRKRYLKAIEEDQKRYIDSIEKNKQDLKNIPINDYDLRSMIRSENNSLKKGQEFLQKTKEYVSNNDRIIVDDLLAFNDAIGEKFVDKYLKKYHEEGFENSF